ncbi:MAG: hypothetical protein AAF903_07970 [Pseudomonadota bacterium]
MVSLIIQTVLLVAIAFILGAVIGCLLRNLFGSAEAEASTAALAETSGAPAIAAGAAAAGAVGLASAKSANAAEAASTETSSTLSGSSGSASTASASTTSSETAPTGAAAPAATPKVPEPPVPTAPVKAAEKPELSAPRKPSASKGGEGDAAADATGDSPSIDANAGGAVAASFVGGAAASQAASAEAAPADNETSAGNSQSAKSTPADKGAPAGKAASATSTSANASSDTASKTPSAAKSTSTAKPATPKKPAAKSKAPASGKSAAKKPAAKATVSAKPKATAAKEAPVGPAAVPDNLKEIRGIGPQNEGRLNDMGVNSFAQIASWKRKDEAYYGEALSFPGRIEREDWVGQAKVLAKGGKTDFSKRVASGNVASSMGKADAGTMGSKPKSLLTAPRDGLADNLTLIDGVGNAIEKKLFKLGIYHFDQIAKMSKAELAWLGNNVGFPGRPERENWAGESKVLAEGGTTDHANRVEKGQIKTSRKSNKDEK